MQNTSNRRINPGLPLLAFLLVLVSSCTSVYFENPVPQSGTALRSIPEDWAGEYLVEQQAADELSDLEQIFRQCYRLERQDASRLLVSTDYRIHEKDMPRLREALEEQKKAGKLIDYNLSEHFIVYQVKSEDDTEPGKVEQQYTALLKVGPWYILPQSIVPFRLFDLDAAAQTDYETKSEFRLTDEWLPGADSISAKPLQLVARQTRQAWFFNTRPDSSDKWSLLYLQHPSKDRLIVKVSYLADSQKFEERIDHYNAIAPFRKVEDGGYVVNPTDQALERLMAEDGLFQTTYLRRIGE